MLLLIHNLLGLYMFGEHLEIAYLLATQMHLNLYRNLVTKLKTLTYSYHFLVSNNR